jgi:peptidyl-prolyl cis-trans isomerase SurA
MKMPEKKNNLKNMNKPLIISFLLFCLTSPFCRILAQDSTLAKVDTVVPEKTITEKIMVDKIVAKVDNYMILQSDVQNMLLQSKESNRTTNACQVLETLVISKVMVAKAEIDSVQVDDKLVENQLDRRMDYMKAQFGTEERIMKAYGKTIGELKSELRKQVKEQMTVQKMQEEIAKNLKITPNEVRKFYNNIPKDSVPFFSTEVEVAQIVKIAKVSKDQKAQTREQLNKIRDRILAGEDFAVLAKEYSEDPGSAKEGGSLGWAKRGMMVPEFEANAFKLKPNEISRVFETEYGFHFMQLIERKGDEFLARHILIRPTYSSDDLEGTTRYLDSLRTKIIHDTLSFSKAAKDYSEDKPSSGNGGLMTDPQSGSTKIFAENLDPTVFFVIDSMKVGQISKPLPYRTEDGKSAVRILFYKSKIAPHQANLKDDWEKLQAAALAEKRNKRTIEWFKKAKNDVFINLSGEYKDCKLLEELQ